MRSGLNRIPQRKMVPAVTFIESPRLSYGFAFTDLADREGLIRLDRRFLQMLEEQAPELYQRLLAARAAPDHLPKRDESDLVVALGPHLNGFVATLFGSESEAQAITDATLALDPIHNCKRLFVQRQAVKKYSDPSGFDASALRAELEALLGAPLTELRFANAVAAWE